MEVHLLCRPLAPRRLQVRLPVSKIICSSLCVAYIATRITISINHGEEFDVFLPPAAPAEYDFSNIADWDYRRGHFPLTPEALLQMRFDHSADPKPPKYVFPAAILLYVCADRTAEEEMAYRSLRDSWDHWFDEELSYDYLTKDPPRRLGLNPEEVNWCKVKLAFLEKQIQSESDREQLGLPKKSKKTNRASEAAALLPSANAETGRSAAAHTAKPAAAQSSSTQSFSRWWR